MISDTAIITAIEADCLWVEVAAKTTCGSCVARQGCGQRLLGKLMAKPNAVRVSLGGRSNASYQLGDEIEIGIAEDALVNGALLVYLLPLVGLLLAGGLAQSFLLSEWGVIGSGIGGLLLGAMAVRAHAWRRRHSERYSPVLLS